MRKKDRNKTPPVLERFELKYTVPAELIGPISRFIAPYCTLDDYSRESRDHFYTIQSVYFDTPGYLFLQQRLARVENRFNMRVRSYGASFEPPYFLEVKQKKGSIIRKFRHKRSERSIDTLFEALHLSDNDRSKSYQKGTNSELFQRLMLSYQANPIVAVQYRRKAYFSRVEQYARVTFDRELSWKPVDEYGQPEPMEDYCSCDDESVFDPGSSIILELKCFTTQVPLWMINLIARFQLRRRSFSKYLTAAKASLGLFQDYPLREPAHYR